MRIRRESLILREWLNNYKAQNENEVSANKNRYTKHKALYRIHRDIRYRAQKPWKG